MKTLLTKAAIIAAQDIQTIDVDVPEWGGTVRLKGMTGAERDAFEESMTKMEGDKRVPNLVNMRAKLVACSLVDDAGAPVFTLEEVSLLASKSAAALSRCSDAAQKLSGMGPSPLAEAKNASPIGPSDSSTSGSPVT